MSNNNEDEKGEDDEWVNDDLNDLDLESGADVEATNETEETSPTVTSAADDDDHRGATPEEAVAPDDKGEDEKENDDKDE